MSKIYADRVAGTDHTQALVLPAVGRTGVARAAQRLGSHAAAT